jgi:hypothetical protein
VTREEWLWMQASVALVAAAARAMRLAEAERHSPLAPDAAPR